MCSSSLKAEPYRFRWVSRLGRSRPTGGPYSKATSAASRRCIPVPALIPFDQQTRKVRELTFREALRPGHNYAGTEHIPLAPGKQATGYRKTIVETLSGRGSEP